MFQRVHLKLTFFCSVITVGILLVMTCIYLSISERTLAQSAAQSFGRDMDVLLTNFTERSTEISNLYLQTLEQDNHYHIYIWDNGVPFLYNSLHTDKTAFPDMEGAIAEYERLFHTHFLMDESAPEEALLAVSYVQTANSPYHISYHQDYVYESGGKSCDVSRICLYRNTSDDNHLTVLVLSSREPLLARIRSQRIRFLLLGLLGGLALTLFAWVFTGRLLRPIVESQQKQSRFVASASHELRTPLSVIRASIDTKAPGYEQVILSECTRMGTLVEDMLLLSSVESQAKNLHLSAVEPDTLLLNLYEQMEPLAQQKKLSLQIQLPDASISPCMADRDRLMQVLYILVQNAISYTPEGGYIRLSACGDGKTTRFSVEDNGIGVSDEDKPHIFERFYRADSARTHKDHFGLGLSIAREIIDAHHGQLLVTDTSGGGSTFIIILSQN